MGKRGSEIDKLRDKEIVRRFKSGETYDSIGIDYGICRERIRQILKRNGIDRTQGGKHLTTKIANNEKRERFLSKFLPAYLCTRAEANKYSAKIKSAYKNKKRNVNNAGEIFLISLPEFYEIWKSSGKLRKMGRGKGRYIMTRIDKNKLWDAGNVRIMEFSECIIEVREEEKSIKSKNPS